jgi:Protein of unknown function (DUF2851)
MKKIDFPVFPESLLQKFWLLQYMQGHILITSSGKRLRIFSPGWWNYEKGPDFKNCEIELEGELLSGDAEIHINSFDWYRHGHDRDSCYDNVILHIVWNNDTTSSITTSSGKIIEEFTLSRYVSITMIESALSDESIKERKSLCCTYFNTMEQDRISQILQDSALARLRYKASKIIQKAHETSFSQILFTFMMRACGYKHTKYLLEEFSELLPLTTLTMICSRYTPISPVALQAVLFGCSELLPRKEKLPYYGDVETRTYLTMLWNMFEQIQKDYAFSSFTRLPVSPAFSRPTNTPIRRLTAISHLIHKSINIDLWELVLSSVHSLMLRNSSFAASTQSRKLRRLWEQLFLCLDDPYWNRRFYFGAPSFKKPQKLIGRERARSIILNAFLPVLFAYSEYTQDIKLQQIVITMYTHYPALKKDSILKLMEKRLRLRFPALHKYSVYQQGLHGIFELFCNNPFGSCRQCPLTLSFQK